MAMSLWVLGEIIDKGTDEESSTWNFCGIFFDREDAIRAFGRIHTKKTESFFIVPVKAGELIWDDVTKYPEFEMLSQNSVC
jgi:hypothetical protein